MPGMQRFVSYIYLYENKEKAGNVGFAKIELRGEECRIEVHLRGTYTNNVSCKIYLFTEKDDFIQGIPIGNMKIQNGMGDYATRIKASAIGETGMQFAKMNGIYITCEDERIFATRWKSGKELPISNETVRVGEPQAPEKEEVPESQPQQQPQQQPQPQPPQEDTMQATEVPMRNIFPKMVWEEQWEKLKKSFPVFYPFSDRSITCVRIELKDLRELPKRYWYLGNNSFLLHGFFNYRYLVLGSLKQDQEEKWFLGIPGVYQHQERVMAAIFGFGEFMAETMEKENQPEPVNQFGYWYRLMDE